MTDQPTESVTMSHDNLQLLGGIFTAMAKDAQWTQNQLTGSLEGEVLDWKQKYANLYADVQEAQRLARSMDIEEVLYHHGYTARDAQRPSWFEPEFRAGR